MKRYLIQLLGGYSSIKEVIDEIKYIQDEDKKNEILTLVVKDLFNTIGPDDILKISKGEWSYQGRILTKVEVEMIKSEAKFFENSKLWKMIQNDIKYQLNKKMYLESNITMDIMWGKLVTYLNDIINTRLQKLKD